MEYFDSLVIVESYWTLEFPDGTFSKGYGIVYAINSRRTDSGIDQISVSDG